MDILVLSLVAGLVVAGGIWMATRDTRPPEPPEGRPDERKMDRPSRPDKSAALKATHQAAALQRTLNERLALADAPDAVWYDAEDVFAELEARNAHSVSRPGQGGPDAGTEQ